MMPERSWLLEASWEVCNKVGGIHTVIVSKLPSVLQEYGELYLSIGPWIPGLPEFKAEEFSTDYWAMLSQTLASQGVTLHYGHWQVPGSPKVVLLEWAGLIPKLNELKARFWEEHALDTLGSNFNDFDTPLLWSVAVGIFTAAFNESNPSPVTLQLHEWLSAGALLMLAKHGERLRTVFTTHATVLGRSLASRGVPIYDRIEEIRPEEAAREVGVTSKHRLEQLGAKLADSFTTVSDLTAEEATHFLGRHPEVITENGLALHELPLLLENRAAASLVRQELQQFVDDYFAPSYPYRSSRSLWQCTTGRFEMRNKGYDIYLQSLAQLNDSLKANGSSQSVVCLLLIATGNRGIRTEALSARLLRMSGKPQTLRPSSGGAVPISPFVTDPNDEIVGLCERLGLKNREEDPVKILYLPDYFDGADGLLNIPLYDLVSACDLGVFPSAYEPWGYTPLECIALGVPAITSDLSGFGQAARGATHGVTVLHRRGVADPTDALTDLLRASLRQTPRELETQRIAAYGVSQQFGWERLYENYRTAYAQAWQ